MAQRVTTMLTCDWPHGGKEVEATRTVHLTVEGASYETDACDTHAERAQRLLAQVTEHARTVKAGKMTTSATRRPRAARNGVNSTLVRAWAKNRGIALSERGRIPRDVVQQYEAAQATP